jgi:hypothetical protein
MPNEQKSKRRDETSMSKQQQQSMCRLTTVLINLPPRLIGPLILSEFHLERRRINYSKRDGEEQWYQFTPTYQLNNRIGYQSFTITEAFGMMDDDHQHNDVHDHHAVVLQPLVPANPYVDIDRVRVVCTRNQMYSMIVHKQWLAAVLKAFDRSGFDFTQVRFHSFQFD